MFDLETLGLKIAEAPIVQIGACVVGRENRLNFEATISYKGSVVADYDTIKFWIWQSQDARNSVFPIDGGGISISKALYEFQIWCEEIRKRYRDSINKTEEFYIIAHGFDLSILKYHLESSGKNLPFSYRNWIDLRSYERQSEWEGWNFRVPPIHPRHSALADAKWQARWFERYLMNYDHFNQDVVLPEERLKLLYSPDEIGIK